MAICSIWQVEAQTYTFTPAGASGRSGPTQSQTDAAYTATTLDGQVTINTQGIQEWTVPITGLYRLDAIGAAGGNTFYSTVLKGGRGASISCEIKLTAGTNIKIIVGQEGESIAVGGGGGASFVVDAANKPLIVAGAGGGASSDASGIDAVTGDDGTMDSLNIIMGGASGNGGNSCLWRKALKE